MKVRLVKEPDNNFDSEAIKVEIDGLGHIGYVANSPYTIAGESMIGLLPAAFAVDSTLP